MSSETFTFMSITAKPEYENMSFEEVRTDDYIKSYQATGRPPPPCPEEPKDDVSRAALNLPPLFQGYLHGSPAPLSKRIVKPEEIPPAQEYRIVISQGEKLHSISCMEEYEHFSHEELRYYAYLRGHKQPPTPVAMHPFVMLPPTPAKDSTAPLASSANDVLQSLSAQPEYNKHSLEELRIAYLLNGRELTSAEIFQSQGQNPSASMALTPSGALPPATSTQPAAAAAASTPGAIPAPIYASTSLKFTFGLR